MSILQAMSRLRLGVVACVLGVVLGGCTTGPARDAIPPFRQGVITANQQSQATFAEVNAMLREQQLDRAAGLSTLNEEAFVTVLPSEDLAVWNRAFTSIADYAGKIESLLAPERRTEIQEELHKLGADLQGRFANATGSELPPGVAGGFVQLGGLLAQMKAQSDALAIIRQADPSVQGIFESMGEAIGESPEDGIRGTVWTNWTQDLGEIQLEFLHASANQKRQVAARYANMLAEREAYDRTLASLRTSILSLGAVHHQLAQGESTSAAGLLDFIESEYTALHEEIKALAEARKNAGGTE
ncbi:MAG: hypothetical protein R3B57_04790 [Phycisphaerales bacterium]